MLADLREDHPDRRLALRDERSGTWQIIEKEQIDYIAASGSSGVEVHVGCGTCERCLEGLYQLCLNYGRAETGHAHIGFTAPGGGGT